MAEENSDSQEQKNVYDFSPLSEILAQSNQTNLTSAISNSTVLTLGVLALAPLVQSMMSCMTTSSDARRQTLLQLNKSEEIGLASMAREITEILGSRTNITATTSSDDASGGSTSDYTTRSVSLQTSEKLAVS